MPGDVGLVGALAAIVLMAAAAAAAAASVVFSAVAKGRRVWSLRLACPVPPA